MLVKNILEQKIIKMFEDYNFSTFIYHGCFDIAAKKRKMLFVKILKNIDALQEEHALNLKILAKNFDAFPLLVGMQTNREKIKNNLVYSRFGIYTVNPETLENIISSKFPKVFRYKGGLFVNIDSKKLRKARKRKKLTQKELGEKINVTKKCIYEHEHKDIKIYYQLAKKLENILDKRIIKPIKPESHLIIKPLEHFAQKSMFERMVIKEFKRIGFETSAVDKSPFDIFAERGEKILTSVEEKNLRNLEKLLKFSEFSNSHPLLVRKKKTECCVKCIEKKELEKFESSEELIEFLKEV
ncbi:MAG: hypothetical protein J7J92_02825 [Candidatus Aenigmarchaeota archaeon]|nr:hypothetical protein [Candidatus Aenigmarchaeota archaeon]